MAIVRPATFSEVVNSRLRITGKTPQELAEKLGFSYEHMRKIAKGEALPSPRKLVAICTALGLDLPTMQRLELSERMQNKYGAVSGSIPGRNADLAKLEAVWSKLSTKQRKLIVAMVDSFLQPR